MLYPLGSVLILDVVVACCGFYVVLGRVYSSQLSREHGRPANPGKERRLLSVRPSRHVRVKCLGAKAQEGLL